MGSTVSSGVYNAEISAYKVHTGNIFRITRKLLLASITVDKVSNSL